MPSGVQTEVKTYQMFINGEWVASKSSKTFPVYDPSTEEVIAQVPDASEPKVADLTVTLPAPVRSKFSVTLPLLRTRAAAVPAFTSVASEPISASSKFQLPEPSVTLAAA